MMTPFEYSSFAAAKLGHYREVRNLGQEPYLQGDQNSLALFPS